MTCGSAIKTNTTKQTPAAGAGPLFGIEAIWRQRSVIVYDVRIGNKNEYNKTDTGGWRRAAAGD
jgi:hypothetical protein